MKIISIKASLLYHQFIFSFARSAADSTVVVSFYYDNRNNETKKNELISVDRPFAGLSLWKNRVT